ncbi:endonuclease [Candidatus Methanoprimaticola sp. MG2]|uniref:endonuclease n=1 Tax=Candidatus Methanoprimaticola sp. MG2 TaxID=3228838 RepID=UPI0039C60A65
MVKTNIYKRIIEHIFFSHYEENVDSFRFDREEITNAANTLDINVPKNIGDLVSAFKSGRQTLPNSILSTAPKGKKWLIRNVSTATYQFFLSEAINVEPDPSLKIISIFDSTPDIVLNYIKSDEQALLAIIRYNRLIDTFLGMTCHTLQSHWRTQVTGIGQIEVDEIYVGTDSDGNGYIIPVQAKHGKEKLEYVQLEQDIKCCNQYYPDLICSPVGCQFIDNTIIAMFELNIENGHIVKKKEKHYRLTHKGSLYVENDTIIEK